MSLRLITRQFVDNLEALRDFVVLVRPVVEKANKDVWDLVMSEYIPLVFVYNEFCPPEAKIPDEELRKLNEQHDGEFTITQNDSEEYVNLQTSQGNLHDFQIVWKQLGRREYQLNLLYRTCLVSLVSNTEWQLSQLIHHQFKTYPGAAPINEKSLTYAQLARFDSIATAREHLVEQAVEEVFRDSFSEWMEFLRAKLHLKLEHLGQDEGMLIELFQRRNLHVHNNGIINSTYLSKVPPKFAQDKKPGQVLAVDHGYLMKAITALEKLFLLIALELWKKTKPADPERAALSIDVTMSHLEAERWDISEALSRFVADDENQDRENCLIGQVNLWQSIKWQNRFDEIRAEVEGFDVSAIEVKFQIAKAALLDDVQEVIKLSGDAISRGKMTRNDFMKWPLFRKLREDEAYQRHFAADDGDSQQET